MMVYGFERRKTLSRLHHDGMGIVAGFVSGLELEELVHIRIMET